MSTRAVLFDLDGTLLDTAPDMLKALNKLRLELQLPELPLQAIRAAVSHGSDAILAAGLADITTCSAEKDRFSSPTPSASERAFPDSARAFPDIATLKTRFLNHYQTDIASATELFQGMEQTLVTLEERQIPWGIVTNKPGYLTFSILDQLDLSARCAVVVCGDTTPMSKPDPLPLQHACGLLNIDCVHTLYVGDAERDIQAGRAAGMTTLVARFGYLADSDQPDLWGADGMIDAPQALLDWLDIG